MNIAKPMRGQLNAGTNRASMYQIVAEVESTWLTLTD